MHEVSYRAPPLKHVYQKALLEQFDLPRMVMRVLRLILSFLHLVPHQMGCSHNDGRYVQSLDLSDLNLEEKCHKNDARYELVRHRIVLRLLFYLSLVMHRSDAHLNASFSLEESIIGEILLTRCYRF